MFVNQTTLVMQHACFCIKRTEGKDVLCSCDAVFHRIKFNTDCKTHIHN